MLKKRSKAISMLLALAFMCTMIMPGLAFAGDPCKISYSTQKGVEDSDTEQDLGFVKISDIDVCDTVYVEVDLPGDVDWKDANAPGTAAVDTYIDGYDGSGAEAGTYVAGDKDDYVVWFDGKEVSKDNGYIKATFNNIIVDNGAPDEIKATVTVKGLESGLKVWEYSEECLIGLQGDKDVTVKVASPKTVSVGKDQKIAKITFEENMQGALQGNGTADNSDTFTLTLPDDMEWSKIESGAVSELTGKYGLAADLDLDDDVLTITVKHGSSLFADKLEFTGYIRVFPNADEGDVEIDVEAEKIVSDCDFDDVSIVAAVMGDSSASIEVDDTADDTIYQADFDKEVDEIEMEATGTFSEGDKITLTLSKGVRWYMTDAEMNGISSDINCEGFYDDNQSVWLEVKNDDVTEINLKGLKVATLPDCPVGDITITVDGDFEGEAVVGEVVAAAEVSADVASVDTSAMVQAAGDITLEETGKKSLDATDGAWDGWTGSKWVLGLSLPTGVSFSDEPVVYVNDDEVDVSCYSDSDLSDKFKDGDSELYMVFSSSDFKTNKIDTVRISELYYDIDSRVRSQDIEVEISGSMVNKLKAAGDTKVKDLSEDNWDNAVFTVVNAGANVPGSCDSVFTIGAGSYTVDGVEYTMDVAPYISGERTYLPVRFVAYAMGVSDNNILWDQAAQTVTLMKGDKVVQLKVGSNTMLINGAAVTMDVAPQNTSDRVCLPIRFVAQAFGAQVGWDAATQQVSIDM